MKVCKKRNSYYNLAQIEKIIGNQSTYEDLILDLMKMINFTESENPIKIFRWY